jgi:hypothetical protein
MDKLEIAINNYLRPKGVIGWVQKFLYKNSKYSISIKGSLNSDVLLFINNEFNLRKDHYRQLEEIYTNLNKAGVKATLISAKRVLVPTINTSYKDQFENVFNEIGIKFKKVLVFCDSVPLQNFLVAQFNDLNITTYSLQHGFYIEDSNEVFLNVYRSSNAKNFFVWDKRTLKFMKKYNSSRNYILSGPYAKINFESSGLKINDKYQVAIFGCGKDQKHQNKYLSDLFLKFKEFGYNPILISHPKLNVIERIILSFKNKTSFKSNKYKNYKYKLALVLNSAVSIELSQNRQPYIVLNSFFNTNTFPDINLIMNINDNFTDTSLNDLSPFLDKQNSLKTIIKEIKNDL